MAFQDTLNPTYLGLYDIEFMRNAITLSFEPYDSSGTELGWDNYAIYVTSRDYALLYDDFKIYLNEGATYDIFSSSYYDPIILMVYDSNGIPVVANSESNDLYYGTDIIFDFVAPKSDWYYINASWDQGVYFNNVELSIFEYIDSMNQYIQGTAYDDRINGGEGDDFLKGGDGIDTALYASNRGDYSLQTGAGVYVIDNVGIEGTDTLTGIERLEFTDINLAIDLDGNGGIAAKIIGATFDAELLSDADFVGEVLVQVDAGSNYESLMVKYIEQAGAFTNEEVVDLLFENLVGRLPNETQSDRFIGFLESGKHSIGSFGVLAAEHRLNDINIDLVGLSQTGLEYTLA